MDINFNKVTYEGELSDFSEDELREIVEKFTAAQESNVAEFEKATEAIDEQDDAVVEDFEKARESLIEDIVDHDSFGEVPVTEETLKDEDFSDLQDWKTFVAGQETGEESEETEGGDNFEDFGTASPTNTDEDTEDFVEEELGSIQGLNL